MQYGNQLPNVHSTMHLYPINGAAHRVGQKETAWSYRDANFVQVIVGVDPDPANEERAIAWSKEYWRKLHPYSAGGAYVKKNATGISNPACTDDLLVGEGDGTAVSGCSCACSGVAVLETCGVFSVKRC